MAERTKLFIVAHVPPELERALLQHVRTFDTQHPGCHFEIGIDGPDQSISEMVEMLRVAPALTFTKMFQRKGDKRTSTSATAASA